MIWFFAIVFALFSIGEFIFIGVSSRYFFLLVLSAIFGTAGLIIDEIKKGRR